MSWQLVWSRGKPANPIGLKEQGAQVVLSLCSEDDPPRPKGLDERFRHRCTVLLAHRAELLSNSTGLHIALAALRDLQVCGSVLVHCLAALVP